ncbi:MAG: HMA2 domain-containing protein [Methylovirgula sp.]
MSRAKHHAKVAHHVPGRMRVKVPNAKGNDELLEEIRQTLVGVPGIHEIEINGATGSVTIHYCAETHPELHASIDQHQDLFSVAHRPPATKLDEMTNMIEREAEFLAEHSHTARVIVDLCSNLDRQVKKATGNTVDLKVLVPLGLAAVTFIEIGATAATPVWVTIGLFSLNHFIELQAHPGGRDDAAADDLASQARR